MYLQNSFGQRFQQKPRRQQERSRMDFGANGAQGLNSALKRTSVTEAVGKETPSQSLHMDINREGAMGLLDVDCGPATVSRIDPLWRSKISPQQQGPHGEMVQRMPREPPEVVRQHQGFPQQRPNFRSTRHHEHHRGSFQHVAQGRQGRQRQSAGWNAYPPREPTEVSFPRGLPPPPPPPPPPRQQREKGDQGSHKPQQNFRHSHVPLTVGEPVNSAMRSSWCGESGGHRSCDNSGVANSGETRRQVPSPAAQRSLQEFKDFYARHFDEEVKTKTLQAQAGTASGVTGNLDVNHCTKLIAEHDVTIIVTDTGTGKSTLIPKAILEKEPSAKIANAQPRRTSAISLAHRVASLCHGELGEGVGYWVRGEHVGMVGKTSIMYVTNYGLFLYFLRRRPDEMDITHIILDEFHERTIEVEVLLLMMKLVMLRNPGVVKLVLCSATAESSKWSNFFKGLAVAEYSGPNTMYPIYDHYLEDVTKLIGMSFSEPTPNPSGAVESIQLRTLILYVQGMLKFLAGTTKPQHSILLFLPGRAVVEQMTQWIRENLDAQLDPIPWYREIELLSIQEAIQRKSTKRKVYVATDIAEVSITLPDVVFVIDSGTSKRHHITPSNPLSLAFPPLMLFWESASNLKQRRGRVGRVQPGFFFTLLSKKQAAQLLPDVPRSENAVVHEVVLHSLYLTPSPFLLFSMCRERPRNESVRLSLSTLQECGCIVLEGDPGALSGSVNNNAHVSGRNTWAELIESALQTGDGEEEAFDSLLTEPRFSLTPRGWIVGDLPFGIGPGAIVFHGLVMGLTTLSIIAACCVSCNTPFYVPYSLTAKKRRSLFPTTADPLTLAEIAMRSFRGELCSDAVASTGAIIEYMAMQREGLSEGAQEIWCKKRHLSRSRINEIILLVKQATEQLYAVVPFEDITDVDELKAQYEKYALPLSLICSAAHMHHGIYVLFDAAMAQRERYAGSGVFVNMNCSRDRSVPTTCPWERDTVCIPFRLQPLDERLLVSFSAQLHPEVFNIMLLVFSNRVVYEDIYDETESVTFEVTCSKTSVYINCDRTTALELLQLRRLTCARQCVLRLIMERGVRPDDSDAIARHLQETGSDFGIPPEMEQHPELLPVTITSSLTDMARRIERAASGKNNARLGLPVARPPPFCTTQSPPPVCFRPTRQSTLVYSDNGCGSYECSPRGQAPTYRFPETRPTVYTGGEA